MELWMWQKMISFANVIMRVPPLFVIDELLMLGMGMPQDTTIEINGTNHLLTISNSGRDNMYNNGIFDNGSVFLDYIVENPRIIQPEVDYPYQLIIFIFLRFLACTLGLMISLCIFMLGTKHLVIVYRYLISIGIVFVSYWSNVNTTDAVIAYINSKENAGSIMAEILHLQFTQLVKNGPGVTIIKNYTLQTFLAYSFCYIHLLPKIPTLQKALAVSFILPTIIGLYPFPTSFISQVPLLTALLPFAVCKLVIWIHALNVAKTMHQGYKLGRAFIANYGLSALAETQWHRLNVPCVLRTFWLLRVAEQLIHMMNSEEGEDNMNYYSMMKTLLVNGCETVTAVLGMTSIVSYICHYIGCFFQWILLTEDAEERSFGTVSAILFYMLALQTGLTSLDKENRLMRLCRNLCLLFTAVLHFVHNIVSPLLMSLNASHNPALHRHLRALGVCAFLIISPICLITFLWTRYTISTWLLAVSVFSIEVLVKVFVSLVIYALFLYDAYHKTFWEQLDDYVYIIRSFGNTVEFAFGIILFFNGFWILVFEAGGAIRAIMMCIHAYFNLWCEAKAGWSVFMKRRTAVNKINSLPEASEEQLRELKDVCAICYQDMESAKITICKHYFHGVCLRKWLYIQDRCPLCHDILYKFNTTREGNEVNVGGNNQNSDR